MIGVAISEPEEPAARLGGCAPDLVLDHRLALLQRAAHQLRRAAVADADADIYRRELARAVYHPELGATRCALLAPAQQVPVFRPLSLVEERLDLLSAVLSHRTERAADLLLLDALAVHRFRALIDACENGPDIALLLGAEIERLGEPFHPPLDAVVASSGARGLL
ncbi:MAG: hypothetical protein ACREH3_06955, partial [Geminicoccales bacterium]